MLVTSQRVTYFPLSLTATASAGDFGVLSASPTFAPGSGDSAQVCSSISILSDNVTELEENFFVILTLVTNKKSLSLGNNITTVIHRDDDGNSEPVNKVYCSLQF